MEAAAEQSSKCSFTQRDSTFSPFYPLAAISNSQPDGFYAKLKVSVTSDYGDIHILLAESDDFHNQNQGYEFGNLLKLVLVLKRGVHCSSLKP